MAHIHSPNPFQFFIKFLSYRNSEIIWIFVIFADTLFRGSKLAKSNVSWDSHQYVIIKI